MTSLSLIPGLSTEDRDTLRDAWKQWGMDMQMTIFEEELSELGEAITFALVALIGACALWGAMAL